MCIDVAKHNQRCRVDGDSLNNIGELGQKAEYLTMRECKHKKHNRQRNCKDCGIKCRGLSRIKHSWDVWVH